MYWALINLKSIYIFLIPSRVKWRIQVTYDGASQQDLQYVHWSVINQEENRFIIKFHCVQSSFRTPKANSCITKFLKDSNF